jgi:serine protease Do
VGGNVIGEVAEKLRRSTVQVRGNRSSGSGVVWGADGKILTNAHVLREGAARVEFWNGRQAPARVLNSDRRRDLAVLQVESTNLSAASLSAAIHGNSDALRPGELVIAVGSPFGFTGAVSTGFVVHGGPWIGSNVRLAPGSSGGPLANARGEVVGLNTMIAGGLALAIPSNAVERFLNRPRLGVVIRPVAAGLLVLEIDPESPAERASLFPGDVLTGFRSPEDLETALRSSQEGRVELEFRRGADNRTRRVVARAA